MTDYKEAHELADFRGWFNGLNRLQKSGAVGAIALSAIMIGGSLHDGLTQTVRYGNVVCSGSDSFETSGPVTGDDLMSQLVEEMKISSDDKAAFSQIIANKNSMTLIALTTIPEGTTIEVPKQCS